MRVGEVLAAAGGDGVVVAAVAEDLFRLVVFQAAGGPDGEGEFGAEVDGGVGGLEGAQPEDERAVLDAEVEAERGVAGGGVWLGEGREEVGGGDGAGRPCRVGGGEGPAFEDGGGFGEGLGEEAELGGEELRRGDIGGGWERRGIGRV